MLAVETSHLTKFYSHKKITALHDVTLTVEAGVIFGLLGPNGAGKTTLIKILLGIVFPTSGTARILGQSLNVVQVKEQVGYLPENPNYPDFLKGGDALDYFGKLSAVEKPRRRRNKAHLLELVEMSEWERTKIRKYSKGMRQRLGLAQAMINDPDILFLDEPTDGVDPIGRKKIRDILLHLKEQGKTIFLNSHLLSEVELICDKVAILDKGRLLQTGTVAELTSPSKTYRFETSAISDEVARGISSFSTRMEQKNGMVEVTVASYKKLNAIIDYLRQHQIDIKAVVPHKHTLEESFIEILQKEVVP
jgi:ABC-2 type transport system ATP-binding protein